MDFAVAHVAGIALSIVAAASFALYYLCVRLGTIRGHVYDVMLISLVTNVVMFVPLVAIVHGVPTVTLQSALAFVAAGVFGSLLGRLVIMYSVEAIGASRTSPIVAANVFVASLLAIVLFDEQFTVMHLVGVILIVGGVAVITYETSKGADPDASLREVGTSIILPILGAILLGFEPIFITLGLEGGSSVLPGVAIKALAATVGFVAYMVVTGTLRFDRLALDRTMSWYLGAGLTSGAGIVALFAALETAPVVIVIPIIQTSPLIVVILSMLFLPKRIEFVTPRLIAGAVVVVVGATLVSLFG